MAKRKHKKSPPIQKYSPPNKYLLSVKKIAAAVQKISNKKLILWLSFLIMGVSLVFFYSNVLDDFDVWFHLKFGEHHVKNFTWNIDHSNYSWTPVDANWKNPYFTQSDDHPVTCVSWYDAVAYCNWKSQTEGLTPCYSGSGSSTTCNFFANGYRLPTEAEWEYAARGGENSRGYTYSGSNSADEVAWYTNNSGNKTHQVGQKKVNEMGLYDMSGNVWEWCNDWYDPSYYGSSPGQNPRGPSSGSSRVVRGGSWFDKPYLLRCAYRYRLNPVNGYNLNGFRCVRTL